MSDDPFIALEIHDASCWEPSRVLPIVETMEQWGYNALALHQNDLLDVCTQLGLTANYGVTDLRLKKVRNATAWLNQLTERLAAFDAELFLEIKEPSYHDYALEFFPNLIGPEGYPDPLHPDWPAFCRQKTEDLLERVPGIGGFVINLSSPESRVSLPDHLATHSGGMDEVSWFKAMILAFYEPLEAVGKRLFVRDFSYTSDMQSSVLQAVDSFDGRVGASVKITAHDYFPEFPQNPVASAVKSPVIFELEAFGEHMGWGAIPNCRVAEFCERMRGARELGASGVLMRTSWEAIPGANALDSLSAVNVFALPPLVTGDESANALVQRWLRDRFGLEEPQATSVRDLLMRSWQIPAAAYWNTSVFPRHSCLPSTWQEGWLSMESSGMGRRDREISMSPDHPWLSDTAQETLFAEKEAATALAEALSIEAADLATNLPAPLNELLGTFSWLPAFAHQFELATKATFHAARGTADDLLAISPLRDALLSHADALEARLAQVSAELPYHHRVLFDPDQVRRFTASLP